MFGPFGHWQGLATEMMIHPQRETNYWHEEIFLCAKASDPILNHASCARPSASRQLQSAKGRDFCKKLGYSRTREGTALRSRKFENGSESEGGGGYTSEFRHVHHSLPLAPANFVKLSGLPECDVITRASLAHCTGSLDCWELAVPTHKGDVNVTLRPPHGGKPRPGRTAESKLPT